MMFKVTLYITVFLTSTLLFSQKEELIWEENFDGGELNKAIWNFELGNGCPELCGWGNEEPQYYTDQNHKLENGLLYITARKEGENYTSTRITTKDKFEFTYGRVEIRARLPVGEGLWPALWMLGSNIDQVGWPICGEIDIMEYVGKQSGQVFNSIHTQDSHGNTKNTKITQVQGIEDGFHTYSGDWNEERIQFFVDGKPTYTFIPENHTQAVWPFNRPFFLIVNLAIGGTFGGPNIDDTIFPQDLIVDYIRVYRN